MDFNITVIGAGVVGLAIGANLSKTTNKVAVLEKNNKFGQETSSRNSEVIHSGIYYQHNSLKSVLCVRGQKLLYDYCDNNNIKYNKCGKYIVATNTDEAKKIIEIFENAKKNGVKHGRIIEQKELNKLEPNIKAVKAIFFPQTGIVDSYSLMKNLETEILNNRADIAYNSEVVEINKITDGYKITVKEGGGVFSFTSKILINATGLFADKISEMVGLKKPEHKLYFCKGEYFAVRNGKQKLLKSLVYPVPNKNISLGIHSTIDISGNLKLGPNAIYVDKHSLNYRVNKSNLTSFYEATKRFLPFIEKKDLFPDQAGIRPQLSKTNGKINDFIITNEEKYGYKNFINLIGIESPGLTSCLTIAEYVRHIIINN